MFNVSIARHFAVTAVVSVVFMAEARNNTNSWHDTRTWGMCFVKMYLCVVTHIIRCCSYVQRFMKMHLLFDS
jgi:hypothetical protein